MDHKIIQVGNKKGSDFNCNENNSDIPPTVEDNAGIDFQTQPSDNWENSSSIQESSEFQWCMDDARKYVEDFDTRPVSIFSCEETQSSYDDISKNIDANLAEIDMETFCSGDINSILSLPAVYGESFSSITDNTHNTTESCSSTGKMETASHSLSEGSSDVSIYKNKPLFSPVKETDVRLGTISTDSLDFSSLEKQDLNLSCQAQKNNYMITFEGSTTQLSEDSNIGKMSQHEPRGSMIQSDIGFTTWGKIQKYSRALTPHLKTVKNKKSCSLPTLSTPSFFPSAIKWVPQNESMLLYNVQSSCCDSNKCRSHSLSLMQLYMQKNVSKEPIDVTADLNAIAQFENDKYSTEDNQDDKQNNCENSMDIDANSNKRVGNVSNPIKTRLDIMENNNNIQDYSSNNNCSVSSDTHENDNSVYFEDSLMEGNAPKIKFAYASPIKEEEPFEFSSGDETVKNNKSLTDTNNDVLKTKEVQSKVMIHKSPAIFSDSKQVTVGVSTSESNFGAKSPIFSPFTETSFIVKESNTQATQTRSFVTRNSATRFFSKYVREKEPDITLDEGNCSCPPRSACNCNMFSLGKKFNVVITKTRNNSTQVPVHIKNKAIQTSFVEGMSWKTTEQDMEEPIESVPGMVLRQVGVSSESKSIYVYYPNYSLPDLSFLTSTSNVQENKSILQPKKSTCCAEKSFKRRAKSSEGRGRPKSFNTERAFKCNPIEDWESLSILLPENVKGMIQKKGAMQPVHSNSDSPLLPFSKQSFPSNQTNTAYSVQNMRKSDIYEKQSLTPKRLTKTFSKRWSLQEPIQQNKCMRNNSSELQTCESPHVSCNPFINIDNLSSYNQNARRKLQDLLPDQSQLSNRKNINNSSCHPACSKNKEATPGENYSAVIPDVPNIRKDKADEHDKISQLTFEYSKPPMEFTVSPNRSSSSDFGNEEPTTIEEKIWRSLLCAKSFIFEAMDESVKGLFSLYLTSSTNIEENHLPMVMNFLCSIYQLLSDGIRCPVEIPETTMCVPDFVLEFLQAIATDANCPLRIQMLIREVFYKSEFPSSILIIHSFLTTLLNFRWLDFWFQYLVSCTEIIQKYYTSTSILYLLTFPRAAGLLDKIFEIIFPVTTINFKLDLSATVEFIKAVDESSFKISKGCCDYNCEMKKAVELSFMGKFSDDAEAFTKVITKIENVEHVNKSTFQSYAGPNSPVNATLIANNEESKDVYSQLNVNENYKSRCNNPNRGDLSKVQQLRQQWEKLALTEDRSLSPVKGSHKIEIKTTPKKLSGKKSSAISSKSDCAEKTHDAAGACRRRSMIPIHKSSKPVSNSHRSGSASSERGRR